MTTASTQNTVEIGERRGLLCAQVRKRLQRQLLCGDRIAGLLQKPPGSLLEEGTRSRVERVEPFAETEAVELVAALLYRLRQRGSHAAALVAQQAQQTQPRRRAARAAYRDRPPRLRGRSKVASPMISTTRGQTACPGLMSRFICDIQ